MKPSQKLIQVELTLKNCTLTDSHGPLCVMSSAQTLWANLSKPHVHIFTRTASFSAGVHNSFCVNASTTLLCLTGKLATISRALAFITRGEGETFISSYVLLSCSPKHWLSYSSHECKGNCCHSPPSRDHCLGCKCQRRWPYPRDSIVPILNLCDILIRCL